MNFVFDVDGTLTPSRDKIDPYFKQFFLSFCSNNSVYLVTGSDFAKTQEQLGTDICGSVKGVFACSGNQFLKPTYIVQNYKITPAHEYIYQNDFELLDSEKLALEHELRFSGFSVRTGNHIEKRIGSVNFSIVGRNASKIEREQYKVWDEAMNERKIICDKLNSMFTRIECVIGGETGIDIYLKGKNKSQVKKHIDGSIVFFGDRCEPGGNDYPLAEISDIVHNVNNWEETEYILRMKYGNSY